MQQSVKNGDTLNLLSEALQKRMEEPMYFDSYATQPEQDRFWEEYDILDDYTSLITEEYDIVDVCDEHIPDLLPMC